MISNESLCSRVATLEQVLYDLRAQRDVEVAIFKADIQLLKQEMAAVQSLQQAARSREQWTDFVR